MSRIRPALSHLVPHPKTFGRAVTGRGGWTPAFDLLCSTSVSEGFPNVVAEAMASGVPCVATDVGDTRRIIEDTGRLVPAGDPAAPCAACDISLDESPERRGERAREARRRIEEHFSLKTTARRYASLWRSLA